MSHPTEIATAATRRRRITGGLALLALLSLLALLGLRSDDPPRAGDPASTGEDAPPLQPPPPSLDAETAEAKIQDQRKKWDEYARGLIESFRSRVYTPARDGGLVSAAATVVVRVEGKEARYAISFDAGKPPPEQITVTAVEEAEGLHQGTPDQVRRFAIHSLRGAFPTVMRQLPPIQLYLTRSVDEKNLVVTSPPFRGDTSMSYSFDDRELVAIRGMANPREREIVKYEWTFWHGRWLLSKAREEELDRTEDYEYDERDGVILVTRARLREGERLFDAAFTYDAVRTTK